MSAKIISIRGGLVFLALALTLTGCKPTGTGALLRGKKYLDRGNYDAAVAQFQTATTLLTTNALAWNFYGVALQHAGKPIEAANAYQRALELDRDFAEARLNLGTLWLEQNKPDDAKTEFTAYTLRWPNDPAGWLKLGSARLRLGETVPAERCFSAVIALKTNLAEAYNGLGLARIQRNKPREAAQFFVAAVQLSTNFAAARLNLATVSHEYLRDDRTALDNYRAWLALAPQAANWNEVNALANELERNLATGSLAANPAVTPAQSAPAPTPTPETKPAVAAAPAAEPKPQPKPAPTTVRVLQSPRAQSSNPLPTPAPPVKPTEVVQVPPETAIVTTPNAASTARPAPAPQPNASTSTPYAQTANGIYVNSGVTPLPGDRPVDRPVLATAQPARPKPVKIIPPTPVNYPRYHYLSPPPPAAGNRRAASSAFIQAQKAEQNEDWAGAFTGYHQAASLDPSWFEAQYNSGVLAQRLKSYAAALASYELALAIQPASVNARYNFALALQSAGYLPDAADELRKILAANPREVRAHLALANLCNQLHDPVQAREHYLKVLELDPRNPELINIQRWLVDNPTG